MEAGKRGAIKSAGHSVVIGRKAAEGCRSPKPSDAEAGGKK